MKPQNWSDHKERAKASPRRGRQSPNGTNKSPCDFCGEKTDEKVILRTPQITKTDGSDVVVCSECLSLYHNQEWDKLTKRVGNHKNESLDFEDDY